MNSFITLRSIPWFGIWSFDKFVFYLEGNGQKLFWTSEWTTTGFSYIRLLKVLAKPLSCKLKLSISFFFLRTFCEWHFVVSQLFTMQKTLFILRMVLSFPLISDCDLAEHIFFFSYKGFTTDCHVQCNYVCFML